MTAWVLIMMMCYPEVGHCDPAMASSTVLATEMECELERAKMSAMIREEFPKVWASNFGDTTPPKMHLLTGCEKTDAPPGVKSS